jgi:hypothetical protein
LVPIDAAPAEYAIPETESLEYIERARELVGDD